MRLFIAIFRDYLLQRNRSIVVLRSSEFRWVIILVLQKFSLFTEFWPPNTAIFKEPLSYFSIWLAVLFKRPNEKFSAVISFWNFKLLVSWFRSLNSRPLIGNLDLESSRSSAMALLTLQYLAI